MEWIFFTSFGAVLLIVLGTTFIAFSIIKRRRRQPLFSVGCCVRKRRRGAIFSAPVVVTTTTQQVPFTPGPQMQHASVYPNQMPYPMGGQQGYVMPMPSTNPQSYPMPQAGYPYPAGGAPYPPGPHENMNPPSYDQVVGTTTVTTTNETFAKQAPYNPSYTG